MDIYQESLEFHKEHKGKLAIRSRARVETKHDLSIVYTPGVAEVSKQIARNPDEAYNYTMKSNSVAVVSDGSAVLGLGDIGGYLRSPLL